MKIFQIFDIDDSVFCRDEYFVEDTEGKSAEDLVKKYFEDQGIKVQKIYHNSGFAFFDGMSEELKRQIPPLTDIKGAPDFFCFEEDVGYFFVEVKTERDSLRSEQIDWLFKCKHPYKLIRVLDRDIKDFSIKSKE